MSDLGAIFHVKKDGVQYDAHAYTTLDECPEPNLKVTYKGQQGYVKLEAKGSGDVPCYVKPKSGSTVYQVKKQYESIPTGAFPCDGNNNTFTVPAGIRVLQVGVGGYDEDRYVGVTPGKTYTNLMGSEDSYDEGDNVEVVVYRDQPTDYHIWATFGQAGREPLGSAIKGFVLFWSPEINKKTPSYTDY